MFVSSEKNKLITFINANLMFPSFHMADLRELRVSQKCNPETLDNKIFFVPHPAALNSGNPNTHMHMLT